MSDPISMLQDQLKEVCDALGDMPYRIEQLEAENQRLTRLLVRDRDDEYRKLKEEIERLEADNRKLRMTIAESLRLIAQTLRSGEVRLDDVVKLLARANSEVSDE